MELIGVAAAAAGLVALAVSFRRSEAARLTATLPVNPGPGEESDEQSDLPCPWCTHPTVEQDRACPGCGRRFALT